MRGIRAQRYLTERTLGDAEPAGHNMVGHAGADHHGNGGLVRVTETTAHQIQLPETTRKHAGVEGERGVTENNQ